MSNKTNKRIHIAYSAVLSLLVIVVGVLLISSCVDIYKSGDRLFSRESISEHFSAISFPVYLCLTWVVGGVILSIALPLEKRKIKAKLSPEETLARLYAKLDRNNCAPHIVEDIRKQRFLRRVLLYVAICLYVIGSALALIYVLNKNNFPAADANREILVGTLAVLINLAFPFVFSIALCIINKASINREIALIKSALEGQNAKPSPRSPVTENPRFANVVRGILLGIGVIFLIVGIINGGASDVVQKAIKICTECIGLG